MTNSLNLTGEQLGAYFGYSLCVSDMDGDGRDDLIVGAPLFTHLLNKDDKYETGRIYIFYQTKNVSYTSKYHTERCENQPHGNFNNVA